jgi:hypothetical protein
MILKKLKYYCFGFGMNEWLMGGFPEGFEANLCKRRMDGMMRRRNGMRGREGGG